VPELVVPTADVKKSFLVAMDELVAENRRGVREDPILGLDLREFGPTWSTDDGFARYVAAIRARSLPETPDGSRTPTTAGSAIGSQPADRSSPSAACLSRTRR
jgi:hypothetical protein